METNIPLYAISTAGDIIVVGGGGGSKDYGIRNGIVVWDKLKQRPIGSYNTEDIIKEIVIGTEICCVSDSDIYFFEIPSEKNLSTNNTYPTDVSGSEQSDPFVDIDRTKKRGDGFRNKKAKKHGIEDIFADTPRIKLLASYKMKVKKVVYQHGTYFILTKGTCFRILDIKKVEIPKNMSENDFEEYFYSIDKSRFGYKRECNDSSILQNWDDFFICGNSIHKVLYSVRKNISEFVYNNKKYEFGGKAKNICVGENNTLCFVLENFHIDTQHSDKKSFLEEGALKSVKSGQYEHTGNTSTDSVGLSDDKNDEQNSSLACDEANGKDSVVQKGHGFDRIYFISGHSIKYFNLSKVISVKTDMSLTSVLTCDGDVSFFVNSMFYSKIHIQDMFPVTNIALEPGKKILYYVDICGILESIKVEKEYYWVFCIVLAIIVLFIAFLRRR